MYIYIYTYGSVRLIHECSVNDATEGYTNEWSLLDTSAMKLMVAHYISASGSLGSLLVALGVILVHFWVHFWKQLSFFFPRLSLLI